MFDTDDTAASSTSGFIPATHTGRLSLLICGNQPDSVNKCGLPKTLITTGFNETVVKQELYM